MCTIEPPEHLRQKGLDSRQAIFHTMGKVSEIMARGGGNGLSLSVLRPKDAPLSKTKGRRSGAVHTGNMFSSLTNWVEQANRRGAQMLTMFDWHPDMFYTNDKEHLASEDELGGIYDFDWQKIKNTVEIGVRFLDKVIDATDYFDDKMKKWQQAFLDEHPDKELPPYHIGLMDLSPE
ncbi:hypothetical protein [Lentibacillus saliphilus]|uniref:hypothetical protein n=1 Tax=Lentibacillus saliphilus TaxID=2737028 RepID=UPI001C2F8E7D|nr:hypothetical protein [Lentibacillus saliphilus]